MLQTRIKMFQRYIVVGVAFFAIVIVSGCSGDGTTVIPPGSSIPASGLSGSIATYAGTGFQGDDGGNIDRLLSFLNQPMEMNFAPDGTPYIVDWNNHKIRRVKLDGKLETVIGQTLPGDWPCSSDTTTISCPGTSLSLNHPMDLVFKSDGSSFFLAAWHNHKVETYDLLTGMVSIVAGQSSPGFSGDGALASAAKMNFPDSIVTDSAGNFLISDERSQRVRRISTADGTIKTVVGNSPATAAATAGSTCGGDPTAAGYTCEGVLATVALLAFAPYNEAGGSDNPPPGGGLALDAAGNLYLADTYNHCIRKVASGDDGIIGGDDAKEVITTIAGICGQDRIGYSGDGAASTALLKEPHDLDFGPDGRLYLTDVGNHVVRAIDLTANTITTVAGTGTGGFSGDGGQATAAQLLLPYGIAFDAVGNLYIADTSNHRIRVIMK